MTSSNSSNLNLIRPYKGYGPINLLAPRFMGNYNALQTSLSKHFRDGSLVNIDYTFSKAMTNSQSDRSNSPANTTNVAAEYGLTLYNRKHVFSANFVYYIPFLRDQRGIVGYVAGGWEISGIVTAASGLPSTALTSSVDPAGLGLLAAGAVDLQTGRTRTETQVPALHIRARNGSTKVFANVPAGHIRPGNASIGSIIGPGYQDWDLSAFKNIQVFRELTCSFVVRRSTSSTTQTGWDSRTISLQATTGRSRVLPMRAGYS